MTLEEMKAKYEALRAEADRIEYDIENRLTVKELRAALRDTAKEIKALETAMFAAFLGAPEAGAPEAEA